MKGLSRSLFPIVLAALIVPSALVRAQDADKPLLIGFRLAVTNTDRIQKLDAKLDAIPVTGLTFSRTPLHEVVATLKKLSLEKDRPSARPGERGVNMVIKHDKTDPEAEVLVTLTLTDVTLREALQRIADQLSLKIEMTPYAVVLRDR